MLISVKNYVDFLSVVNRITGIEAIFYTEEVVGNTFRIWAILRNERVCASGNLGTKPGSFDTDFPDAVAITDTDFGIGV